MRTRKDCRYQPNAGLLTIDIKRDASDGNLGLMLIGYSLTNYTSPRGFTSTSYPDTPGSTKKKKLSFDFATTSYPSSPSTCATAHRSCPFPLEGCPRLFFLPQLHYPYAIIDLGPLLSSSLPPQQTISSFVYDVRPFALFAEPNFPHLETNLRMEVASTAMPLLPNHFKQPQMQ